MPSAHPRDSCLPVALVAEANHDCACGLTASRSCFFWGQRVTGTSTTGKTRHRLGLRVLMYV
jgi:hypothetical protein